MSDTDCSGCAREKALEPTQALARLQQKNEQLASVLSRFMATVASTTNETRSAAFDRRKVVFGELDRELARIVGGHPTLDYEECCLVGHRNPNGTIDWFCTGVLVHSRIVLTAGHCFRPSNQPNVVALKASNQNALQNAEIIDVRRAVVHPRYIQTHQLSDMTVLVLRTSSGTTPARIATGAEIAAGAQLTLVGFGYEDIGASRGFGVKREVDVDFVSLRRDPADDLDADEQRFGYESDVEFVAGGNGFDSCNGDSGGPAYLMVDGTRSVAGLTSRATHGATHPCGSGGIYTRVDVHLDFIRQVAADAGIGFPG
jgi:endonuclease G